MMNLAKLYEDRIVPNLGVYLTLISQFFNSCMIIFCKLLITDKDFKTPLHPLQILFVRMAITYVFCIIYFVFYERNPNFPLGPKGFRFLHLLRAVGGFVGVVGQYWSLLYLNVSDTVCITFLAPTVTSFMAYIFLGERFTKVEAIGGFTAFCGVLLIAKPRFLLDLLSTASTKISEKITEDDIKDSHNRLIGSTFAFVSTFGTGTAMCAIRKIGFNSHPLLMVSIYALFTTVASFLGILIIPGIGFQTPHTVKQWTLLIVIGVTGFFMQFLLTAGMQREKAARAIAMTYTQLVYASIFDYITNGKIPQGWSLIGEIIIVLSVFSIVYFKDLNQSSSYTSLRDSDRDLESDAISAIELQDNLEGGDTDSNFKISSESEPETNANIECALESK
ncbi:uncharacterized protein C5L36_0E01660 [Pichia kudriavzevii]|uniref:EamA domain-containing protein n=3 Tax=Pichia kudriavzevii TaxID=4909 RepID=A0A2U9R9Q3_PICKU|nr:uncharacterized protein C5L36_0E01660 [Pichia kudriavzevii]AWU78103.1 hypothetical protein C5L36_0E01660 [Pichia kudriavzevii]